MFDAALNKSKNIRLFFCCALAFNLLIGASAFGQSVTLYENDNFAGRSQTFGIGEHRLTDFNDLASSVKVPAGLVAMIFEHSEDGAGYGAYVDLLEDRPSLTPLGFNNKTSYLTVFATPDARRFIWARNSLKNGQFMPGHWERARAGGNPANTVAVVAPPLPPRSTTRPTVIQINDADSVITSLGTQSTAESDYWSTVESEGMGVVGSDYRGKEEIGTAAFERKSHNSLIPDNINFWFPQNPPRAANDHRTPFYKRTLSGIVDAVEEPYIVNIEGTYRDFDMTFNVRPFPKYQYLISDGHKPEQSKLEAIKRLVAERKNPYGACDEPFKFVHSEIDTRESAKNQLDRLIKARAGKQISAYGPWIYDKGHCHHPEIHPAEQIWWSEQVGNAKKFNLNIFCDASKRFWWRHQMDDGTKLKPWGAPPIRGIYALSFEVELKPGKYFGKKFEVRNIDHWNVIEYPNANKVYNLTYQGNALVSFTPNNNAFKVSYEKVGLKPGTTNIVRGFLVIETSVGKVTQIASKVDGVTIPYGTDPNDAAKVPEDREERAFKKEEGHYLFTVLQTNMR